MAPKRVPRSSHLEAGTASSSVAAEEVTSPSTNSPSPVQTKAAKPTAHHPPPSVSDAKNLDSFLHSTETTAQSSRQHGGPPAASPSSTPSAPVEGSSTTRATTTAAAAAAADVSYNANGRSSSENDVRRSTESRTARYQRNWSQTVIGAMSGILFVCVAGISYALYVLVEPYFSAITAAVLASIVMHPQSRLRPVLYTETTVDRMRRVQQQWAAHGSLAGVVGSWLSLRHFASSVVMEVTFFLGLNKIRVVQNSFLLGSDTADEAARARESRTSSLKPRAAHQAAQTAPWAAAPPVVSSLEASMVLSPTSVAASAHHCRLVATARGRRVLRCVTVAVVVTFAYLLLGLRFFVVVHLVLAGLFVVVAPFRSPEKFVRSMGRVWRAALVGFFVVGLSVSLALDVLPITRDVSQIVKQISSDRSGLPADLLSAITGFLQEFEKGAADYANSAAAAMGNRTQASADPHQQHHRRESVTEFQMQSILEQKVMDALNNNSMSPVLERLVRALPPQMVLLAEQITGESGSGARTATTTRGRGGSWTSWLPGQGSAKATAGDAMDIDLQTRIHLLGKVLSICVMNAIYLATLVFTSALRLSDSIYSSLLFVICYKYLTRLEHTVLYYGLATLLRALDPLVGEIHARNIEHDITTSVATLLQSFWQLTWFHFCVTFCAFQLWGLVTPFLMGLLSVALALFPVMPKLVNPCAVAFVYAAFQLFSLTTDAASEDSPFFVLPDGAAWTEGLIFGKPYLRCYARVFSLGVATLLECGDEWLLCVSRGLSGGFATEPGGKRQEPLPNFVVYIAVVLGIVVYGVRGIVLGPLTVIVARVLFDNWSLELSDGAMDRPPTPPFADEDEGKAAEKRSAGNRTGAETATTPSRRASR